MFLTEIVDHGGRRRDAMRALAQWWYPVSLSEAQDVLHRAMHPTSHHRNLMSIKIACDSPAFFVVVDLLFAYNVS